MRKLKDGETKDMEQEDWKEVEKRWKGKRTYYDRVGTLVYPLEIEISQ